MSHIKLIRQGQLEIGSNKRKQNKSNQKNFSHNSSMKKSQSNQQSLSKTDVTAQSNENTELFSYNSFAALKKLKEKNHQLDTMKRRISKMKVQQDKMIDKLTNNQRKIMYHNKVQQSALQDRNNKEYYFKKLEEKINLDRQSFNNERYSRKNKILSVRSSVQSLKHEQYKQVKRTSQFIQSSIKNLRENDSLHKKNKKQQIALYESQQKKNISKYNAMKKLISIRDKQKIIRQSYSKVLKNQQQIQSLNKLEMEMIERQSKSRSLLMKSKKQTQTFFNPQTRSASRQGSIKNKNEKQIKLPQLNLKLKS